VPTRANVLWWNVQRLLSPTNSGLSRALDATPAAGWTRTAYTHKLERLAAVLNHLSPSGPPALLALCEVENARIASDLRRAAGWDSLKLVADPEARLAGDDLVLLYDPNVFELVGDVRSYNVHNRYTTRDLLETEFRTSSGDVLAVITAHWPSRMLSGSEPLRIGLADYTRRLIEARLKYSKDELVDSRGRARLPAERTLAKRWNAPILLLGDLNDSPFDTSVSDVLGAGRSTKASLAAPRFPQSSGLAAVDAYLERSVRLYNPAWPLLTRNDGPDGTHYWSGEWYMLDQAILSRGLLLESAPVRYVEDSFEVHDPASVPLGRTRFDATSRSGIPKPFDAKTGEGVSDHLPLTLELELA
jgi:endonuclease/exonuclease/phosphatase family metal-dependent hydrolase